MAVPTAFSELSTTAASNPPADTEGVSQGDDQFRAVYAFIRSLYEGSTNGQIAFPATQNASANANTLDDYEEGDWTPTDASGAGLTLSVAVGRYVKVGKIVNYWARVQYPATANGSSSAIGGLPFTSANPASLLNYAGWLSSQPGDLIASGVVVPANGTSVHVWRGASTRATNAELTGAALYFGGTYEASA